MSSKTKVLFLSAWYPNRYDAMAGLFVRKHAEAVSQYADVCVLYLHLDDKIDDFQIVEQSYNEVREIVVYIPVKIVGYLWHSISSKASDSAIVAYGHTLGSPIYVRSIP